MKLKDGVALDHESETTVDVTVTATDDGGNQIRRTFHHPGRRRERGADRDRLSGNSLVENVARRRHRHPFRHRSRCRGQPRFEVSGDRFEIVNGQLKLKDGISDRLRDRTQPRRYRDRDRQRWQQSAGLSRSRLATSMKRRLLTSARPNSGLENDPGAGVGTLSVADPDASETQAFAVSDDRFEVVDGQLQAEGRHRSTR
ncbi:MAG: hypothetical protein R3D05_10105 [Dongiaceae bacterium]